ncbi:MAG TPA: hypothetical protein VHA30_00855 [Patescibacteria group bacterium]|nr:hypothetical protein [Patescibacteria group bacterium]
MDISTKSINIGLPPQIKSSRNALVELVLLIIIAVLFLWFVVLPKKSAVDAKNQTLQDYTQKAGQVEQQMQTLKNLVGELHSNTAAVAKLDEAIPLSGNPTEVQMLVQSLADSAGVSVGDINVSGKSDAVVAGDASLLASPYAAGRSLQELNGSVYVTGSFAQLLAFLQKIESSGRLMSVYSLTVTTADNNSLSMRLSFTAYYFAP